MKRTILFVGAGTETLPGVRRAKEMGLRVVVSDRDVDAPCFREADETLVASTYDVAQTVCAATEFHQGKGPLHGVLCLATDVPLTVATVAAALGLPGIPLEAARLAMDKLAMKQKFAADGVPVPWYAPVGSLDELRALVARRGRTLILKPVDSRGARGVLRLAEGVDLAWAFEESRRNSPTGRVMVEEFLPGPQVSTESIVLAGVAHTPGFSDRNYEFLERYAPFVIENGGELPSRLSPATQQDVRALVGKAAASMGISQGVVKGDIVVSEGRPYVIELAARLSGGLFCTHEIPLSTGVDFVGCAIRLALGEPLDPAELLPRFERPVAQRYLFPSPGRVTAVEGVAEGAAGPGVVHCEVRVTHGAHLAPIHNHPARAGVVIAVGATVDDAVANARRAVESIRVETVPDP